MSVVHGQNSKGLTTITSKGYFIRTRNPAANILNEQFGFVNMEYFYRNSIDLSENIILPCELEYISEF